MKITFNVTQEDIDKFKKYEDTENCLGCVCLRRVLLTDKISFGGTFFKIDRTKVSMSLKFADYLLATKHGKVKPKIFTHNIPNSVLEQIGYFEKKGTTFVDDYIKENNEVRKLSRETKHQRHALAEEKSH